MKSLPSMYVALNCIEDGFQHVFVACGCCDSFRNTGGVGGGDNTNNTMNNVCSNGVGRVKTPPVVIHQTGVVSTTNPEGIIKSSAIKEGRKSLRNNGNINSDHVPQIAVISYTSPGPSGGSVKKLIEGFDNQNYQ